MPVDGVVGVLQSSTPDRLVDNEVLTNGNAQTVYRQRVTPGSRFTRTLKFEPGEGEEIRRDETLTDDYHGVAPDGSATDTTVWAVVRFYKTAGLITRVRFRTGVAWDSRTSGWA